MKIQYIGTYPASTAGIGEHQVGEVVDVPRDLGERLIKQANWQKPETSQKSPKKEQKGGV